MKELENIQDIKLLVDSFYNRVNGDDMLSPVFNEFAKVDWETHLPKMYNFWNTILFSAGDYKGSPYEKHESLPVMRDHFDRWLELFNATVDELFEGKMADEAKKRAQVIGLTFWSKIAHSRNIV
jgi:hemoglobin